MILRVLNLQGMLGIAASLLFLGLVLVKAGEARHWRLQSGRYEQLYLSEQSARVGTVANYRAAAETARQADLANAAEVAAAQRNISERTSHDFEIRLADVRAHAQRLQLDQRASATVVGSRRAAPVPAAGATSGAAGGAAQENGFPLADRLIATEQAVQLDELIRWVRAQAAVSGERASEPGDARR